MVKERRHKTQDFGRKLLKNLIPQKSKIYIINSTDEINSVAIQLKISKEMRKKVSRIKHGEGKRLGKSNMNLNGLSGGGGGRWQQKC